MQAEQSSFKFHVPKKRNLLQFFLNNFNIITLIECYNICFATVPAPAVFARHKASLLYGAVILNLDGLRNPQVC